MLKWTLSRSKQKLEEASTNENRATPTTTSRDPSTATFASSDATSSTTSSSSSSMASTVTPPSDIPTTSSTTSIPPRMTPSTTTTESRPRARSPRESPGQKETQRRRRRHPRPESAASNLNLPRFVLTNADSGIVTDLTYDDDYRVNDAAAEKKNNCRDDGAVEDNTPSGSSFPWYFDDDDDENDDDDEENNANHFRAISWRPEFDDGVFLDPNGGGGGGGNRGDAQNIGDERLRRRQSSTTSATATVTRHWESCPDCERLEAGVADLEEVEEEKEDEEEETEENVKDPNDDDDDHDGDVFYRPSEEDVGKVPGGGGATAAFRWINDSILIDGQVVNLSDADLLYGDRWRQEEDRRVEDRQDDDGRRNGAGRRRRRKNAEVDGDADDDAAAAIADNAAAMTGGRAGADGAALERMKPIVFKTSLSSSSSSNDGATAAAANEPPSGSPSRRRSPSSRSPTTRNATKWPWRPKPNRNFFEDRLPLPRLGSNRRLSQSLDELRESKERKEKKRGGGGGGGGGGEKLQKEKNSSFSMIRGKGGNDSFGKTTPISPYDSLPRLRKRWRSSPALSSSSSTTSSTTTICSCRCCCSSASNSSSSTTFSTTACCRMWRMLGVCGGGDDADDDGELFKDSILLSITSGNYWRMEEDDEWLEAPSSSEMGEGRIDAGDNGEASSSSSSREFLDVVESAARDDDEDPLLESRPRLSAAAAAAVAAAAASEKKKAASIRVDESSTVVDVHRRRRFSLPTTTTMATAKKRIPSPPSWMSTIARRHLNFYHLVAPDDDLDKEDAIVDGTAVREAAEDGAAKPLLPSDDDAIVLPPIPTPSSLAAKGFFFRCSAERTPLAQWAQQSPRLTRWAATPEKTPGSPCVAHSTPTVKRSDSKVNWKRRWRETPLKGEDGGGGVGEGGGGGGGGGPEEGETRAARFNELKETAREERNFSVEEMESVDVKLLDNKVSSNASSSTTTTKTKRHPETSDRCYGDCSTTEETPFRLCESDRSLTTTLRSADWSGDFAMPISPSSSSSSSSSSPPAFAPAGDPRRIRRVEYQTVFKSKMRKLHPDFYVFVERTIPKICELAVIFVNNWKHDRY